MVLSKEATALVKNAKSYEELKAICADKKLEIGEDKLRQAFDFYHADSAEVSDDELQNVAGGECYSSGVDGPRGYHKYLIVTGCISCASHTALDAKNYDAFDSCLTCGHSFTHGLTSYCELDYED